MEISKKRQVWPICVYNPLFDVESASIRFDFVYKPLRSDIYRDMVNPIVLVRIRPKCGVVNVSP